MLVVHEGCTNRDALHLMGVNEAALALQITQFSGFAPVSIFTNTVEVHDLVCTHLVAQALLRKKDIGFFFPD